MTGSHEVRGSNPLISTKELTGQGLSAPGLFFFVAAKTENKPKITQS